MMADFPKPNFKQILLLLILLLCTGAATLAIVIFTPATSIAAQDLQFGDVAAQDILAPSAVSYTSDVRTLELKEAVLSSVAPRYTQADTNIARQQLERLRAALAYISSVRSDIYANEEQKLNDLAALQEIQIRAETAVNILALIDTRWQAVQQETIVVLEQVMRNTIREGREDDFRSNVPNLVSLALPEDQALIVAELAAAFIAPNSIYSETLTETVRQQAAEAVEPVQVSFAAGEIVVQRGEVISEAALEALRSLGLAQPEHRWQELTSAGLLVLLSLGLAVILFRRQVNNVKYTRGLFVIVALFLAFLSLGRLALPMHPLAPYLFPLAAYPLIIASLFGEELALVSTIPLILLIAFDQSNSAVLLLFFGTGSLFGVLMPKREQRISAYLWVGITVAASGSAVITAFHLLQLETNLNTLVSQTAMTLLNGLMVSGITVLLQYLLAPILGQITPLQLLELSRPDSELLEYLLRNAPGTYQHSLQVANLAEQAAERIDADSLLTRVGALYHDIGKAANPFFFIENQRVGQIDTHDHLDPAESAAVIIRHVTDGLVLARKHRLPDRIKDFIAEHHGTLKTYYQWAQAVNAAQGDTTHLDENLFKYPGPRPQSRETALVMLADGCEARVRAQKPETEDALREMIKDTIDKRLAQDQLHDTRLTLQELDITAETFFTNLRGIYHPRVDYPTLNIPTQPIKATE